IAFCDIFSTERFSTQRRSLTGSRSFPPATCICHDDVAFDIVTDECLCDIPHEEQQLPEDAAVVGYYSTSWCRIPCTLDLCVCGVRRSRTLLPYECFRQCILF